MTQSREIHLVRRPDGMPRPEDFAVVATTLPDPADGELLVQNLLMSVDPYMRPRFNGDQALGEALIGGGIGRVIGSRHAKFSEGRHRAARRGHARAVRQRRAGPLDHPARPRPAA